MKNFIEFCCHHSDVVCNQKYGDNLPYSFHLKAVAAQFRKFRHLLPDSQLCTAEAACYAHELIEDSRMTYNDISTMYIEDYSYEDFPNISKEVAEIVYLCTDFKGKSREDRKPKELYDELATNKTAMFVKLCDIIANSKYSALQNSSMLCKYKDEYYNKVKPYLLPAVPEYTEMFNYLEKIYEL